MARIQIWKRFFPEWGNVDDETGEKLPESEQWSIELYMRPNLKTASLLTSIGVDTDLATHEGQEALREVLRHFMRNPRGFFVADDSGEYLEITTVGELVDYADLGFYNEIMELITQFRDKISGEASAQSSGGDSTTSPDETAPPA